MASLKICTFLFFLVAILSNVACNRQEPAPASSGTNAGISEATGSAQPANTLITTKSGLQYQDLVPGFSNSPHSGSQVTVHYTGWLTDGSKFDSSLDRNAPFTFKIGTGEVIPGWDEGIMTMKVGGKRKLLIPAALGYGAAGAGKIPPNADLVFEVILLDVR